MRRLRELHDDERGTTMMEMVVGMALLATFMSMFTAAMLLMSSNANKVEAVTTSSGQVNNAFLFLDRSVRYAGAISAPIRSGAGNDWNVEYSTTDDTSTVCTQLRVHGTQLQRRSWTVGSTGATYSGLSAWTPLASNVTNGGAATTSADRPFSVPADSITATTSYQRLTITLMASSGTSTRGDTRSTMTFTALNSKASATNTPCQQVSVDVTP